jgi:hypothetical protein
MIWIYYSSIENKNRNIDRQGEERHSKYEFNNNSDASKWKRYQKHFENFVYDIKKISKENIQKRKLIISGYQELSL